MKKIKLAILALVLVTVTTAFTWQHNDDNVKSAAIANVYFEYRETNPGGVNEPSNWFKISESSISCMEENGVLCTIKAPIADANDTHPDFTGITDVLTDSRIEVRLFKP